MIIFHDYKLIDDIFNEYSPYRLKNDVKNIDQKTLEFIGQSVNEEVISGPRGRTYTKIYISRVYNKIHFAKIRVEDITRKKGKSGGYRCIILVDERNEYCFILHIYRHKDVDDITKSEINKLKKLTDEYAKSLMGGAKNA